MKTQLRKAPEFGTRIKKYYEGEGVESAKLVKYSDISEHLLVRQETHRIREFLDNACINIDGMIYFRAVAKSWEL